MQVTISVEIQFLNRSMFLAWLVKIPKTPTLPIANKNHRPQTAPVWSLSMYDQKLGFLPVGRETKREKNCSEKWLVNIALLVATNHNQSVFFSQ